jgi:hypothetical protein
MGGEGRGWREGNIEIIVKDTNSIHILLDCETVGMC